MKKKEVFGDDGEETSADLSEFDDYKPFEGEDEIENLDDDFSFLNGKSNNKGKASKADEIVREIDDFDFDDKDNEQKDLTAKQESADKAEMAPEKREKIVERIVIKEVGQKKPARPVRPLDVKPKAAAVNAVKRPAETDFFREHTEHIKINVEPVKPAEVKKHSNGYLKQLQREKLARKKEDSEEKEVKEAIAPVAAKEPESRVTERVVSEKPAQKEETRGKKTEQKQLHKIEHNQKKKLKHKIFRRAKKEEGGDEVEHKHHHEKKTGNNTLKTILIVLVIIAALAGTYYFITYAQKNQAIASVNGDKITLDNFNRQLNVFIFTESIPEDIQAKIDKDAYLAILITETIMQKEAEKKGIGVTDINIADEMKLIFNSTPYTEDSLKAELASNKINYEDFKNFVKRKKSEQNLMDWASANYAADENKSLEVYSQLYEGKGASYDSVKEAIKLGLYRSEVKKQYNVSFFIATLNAVEVPTEFEQCIYDSGAAKDTIIFYYSEKSDISMEMKPITLNLKSLGYKFYYSEISENSWLDILKCFDKKTEGIPQFICAGTQEVMLGKVEGVTLKAFADKCREEASKPKAK